MQKRIVILSAALVLPSIAVIAWMCLPSAHPFPNRSDAQAETTDTAAAKTQSEATPSSSGISPRSKITRTATDVGEFSEQTTAPLTEVSTAPATPAPETHFISPRYTLTTQPNATTLAGKLANHPLDPDERIRVIPSETSAPADPASQAAGSAAPVLLKLDATLHDPVAWLDDGKPSAEEQANVKAKIASEFEAEVAAAAKQPENAAKSFDDTWKDARAKANREYQKFYGDAAMNRAAINAGRAALSKQ